MKAILDFLKQNKENPTLIVVHSRADADAIASAAALAGYFSNTAICAPDSPSASGRRVCERFGVKLVKFKELSFSPSTIVMMDANSYALLPGMKDFLSSFSGQIAVIDHHSIHSDALNAQTVFVDNRASSTSEIVYEIFRELNYPVSLKDAEMLLSGILSDSGELKTASTRTLEVLAYLLKRTPLTLAQICEFIEGVPDASYRIAVLKALSRSRVSRAGDFIFAFSEANTHEAVTAEKLVALGADYAFVAQDTRTELRISGRCRPSLVTECGADVSAIMCEVGKFIGGSGGGHAAAAGANGPEVAKLGDALKLAEILARDQLKTYFEKKVLEKT